MADFSAAGNLQHPSAANTTTPEAAGDDFDALPVTPAGVEVWATVPGLTRETNKLEGLAVLSAY